MQFDIWTKGLAALEVDCLAVGVYDDGELTDEASALDLRSGGQARAGSSTRGDFPGRSGETLLLTDLAGHQGRRACCSSGLGARKNFSRKAVPQGHRRRGRRRWRARASRRRARPAAPSRRRTWTTTTSAAPSPRSPGNALYRVNDLKTAQEAAAARARERCWPGPVRGAGAAAAQARARARRRARRGRAKCSGISPTCPATSARPPTSAIRRKALAKKLQVGQGHRCWTRPASEGKDGLLPRRHAGQRRAAALHRHRAPAARSAKGAPVVLVGKGITFDTGGISLKDPPTMDEMKFDMSGAACVLGTHERWRPSCSLPLTSSASSPPARTCRTAAPSSRATSSPAPPGHTVEILNTDAEGRLILCDALHYARRFKPAVVVDIATLTGAWSWRSARTTPACSRNDDALARELVDCGAARRRPRLAHAAHRGIRRAAQEQLRRHGQRRRPRRRRDHRGRVPRRSSRRA